MPKPEKLLPKFISGWMQMRLIKTFKPGAKFATFLGVPSSFSGTGWADGR
jgi:hypothetical protein